MASTKRQNSLLCSRNRLLPHSLAYDLLDILFVVQRQMEVIHKTQQEEFSSSKTLENSFQVVSDHLETLLDSMSMWIADMEDMTQVPLQEHENEDLTGMQMG